jgi:hypothetical protein
MLQEILAGLLKDGTLWGMVVALVGGFILHQWPTFPNRFIPIATAVVAIITQFINFFHGIPGEVPIIPAAAVDSTTAFIAMPIATASIFSGGLFKAIIAAVLQWITTDKVYTTQKKLVIGLKANSDLEAKKMLGETGKGG